MRSLLLASLVVLTAPGCVLECNAMYAPDNLEIVLNPALTDAGSWEIVLEGDLETTCAVVLPLAEGEVATCDNDAVSLLISASGDAIEGVSLFGYAPDSHTISFSLDGTLVSSHDLEPEYELDEPNGKGCGERRSGVVEIDPSGG